MQTVMLPLSWLLILMIGIAVGRLSLARRVVIQLYCPYPNTV